MNGGVSGWRANYESFGCLLCREMNRGMGPDNGDGGGGVWELETQFSSVHASLI